eukprot:scaffold1112_cov116-Isochrysis_galbana.AAC.20
MRIQKPADSSRHFAVQVQVLRSNRRTERTQTCEHLPCIHHGCGGAECDGDDDDPEARTRRSHSPRRIR